MGYQTTKPCARWGSAFNLTMTQFGFNFAGEYSLAVGPLAFSVRKQRC